MTHLPPTGIPENIAHIRARARKAARHHPLAAQAPTLIAVSKGQPHTRILAALEAGQRAFGENRVQETLGKWPPLCKQYPDIELHLIGPLQSNKVKEAVGLYDVIHTLDREKLATALADEIQRSGRHVRFFIQVNTGEEPQKAGILPQQTEAFIHFCRHQLRLDIIGLMCIPPANECPAQHFGLLYHLAKRHGLTQLSMGMSGDFETAIAFGATHIRIGTALFGERDYPPATPQ